ncbi:MAG: hypothetical protein KTV77_00590 [Wolbachia endosymbiont of Fragariocoptes setiger]|nr:hypothetical protein [Wolbachia endosymbiont of Fragariocoptes setiger]
MKLKLSGRNSKIFLSTTNLLVDQSQKYFATLQDKKSSSIKKIINTALLIPIITPTTSTVLILGFSKLFVDSVSAQKNDSLFSTITKSTFRFLIYILAALILIPCIIVNLAISLIPALIYFAINKYSFNPKNIEENSQYQKKDLEIKPCNENYEEFNDHIIEELNKFGNDDQNKPQSDIQRTNSTSNHNILLMDKKSKDENKDKFLVVKNINNGDIENGECIIHSTTSNNSTSSKGIFAFKDSKEGSCFASAMNFQCTSVQDGLDLQFSLATRKGENKQKAILALKESKVSHAMLDR